MSTRFVRRSLAGILTLVLLPALELELARMAFVD